MPVLGKGELCWGCELHEQDLVGFVAPEGHGTLGVLMMGEAGGRHERAAGLPFRPNAPAGSVLERAIKRAGFSRSQFRIMNTVNCSPKNDWLAGAPWEFGAIAHCEQHRRREINRMKPKVILALGGIAFRTLTGFDGSKQGIALMRGYPIDTEWGLVIGSYHPSFLVRGNMRLLGVLIHDIQKAVQIARQGFQRREVRYMMRPSLEDAEGFYADALAHPELSLAFDIETGRTQTITEEEYGDEEDHTPIISIQFSLRPDEGIFMPWVGGFIDIAARLIGLRNPLVGHNSWRFDLPKLRAVGVGNGAVGFDTMEAFRHLQRDLVGHYNLQSVASFYGMDRPWKHLSNAEPEYYGCADVDAVQRIWTKLPADLKARGLW
jgi:DNA polymerase